MPKLTLKFKNNTIHTYEIAAGRSLTIGRLEDNDIVIENLAVSGHHAKIDSVEPIVTVNSGLPPRISLINIVPAFRYGLFYSVTQKIRRSMSFD